MQPIERWDRRVFSWTFKASHNPKTFLQDCFWERCVDRSLVFEGLSIFSPNEPENGRIILTFSHDMPNIDDIDFVFGRGMAEFIINEHARIYGNRDIGGCDSEVNSKCGLGFRLEDGEEFDDAAMLVAKQLLTILGVNDGEHALADFIVRQDTFIRYQEQWITLKEFLTRKYGLPKFSVEKEREAGIFEEGVLW